MGLSCECSDFNKGDYANWWELGGLAIPPAGTKCCECGAPLLAEECQSFDHMEVWEPEGELPHPDTLPDEEQVKLSEAKFDAMERAYHGFLDAHGWDSETERYELCTGSDYRCERCSDLAASIEDLGYCLIAPSELIEDHGEFISEHGYAPRLWRAGPDGVLNPYPWRRRDHVAAWLRRKYLNTRYFLRYGWKLWLRWKVYERIRHPVVAYKMWKFWREYRRKGSSI